MKRLYKKRNGSIIGLLAFGVLFSGLTATIGSFGIGYLIGQTIYKEKHKIF